MTSVLLVLMVKPKLTQALEKLFTHCCISTSVLLLRAQFVYVRRSLNQLLVTCRFMYGNGRTSRPGRPTMVDRCWLWVATGKDTFVTLAAHVYVVAVTEMTLVCEVAKMAMFAVVDEQAPVAAVTEIALGAVVAEIAVIATVAEMALVAPVAEVALVAAVAERARVTAVDEMAPVGAVAALTLITAVAEMALVAVVAGMAPVAAWLRWP